MANRPLGVCPTCRRELDDMTRASMGLRNGEVLNALCPGRIGPSDIDHVLHNGKSRPEVVYFLEYKDGAPVRGGQDWLFRSLRGEWQERTTGRLLNIYTRVLQQHEPDAAAVLGQIVDFMWPGQSRAA